MTYQPKLARKTVAVTEVRYRLHRKCERRTPADTLADEPHIHDCYELYFHLGGDVDFLVNNRLYRMERGDWILTRPGDVHLCIYRSPCLHEHYCLWLSAEEDGALLRQLERLLVSPYRRGADSAEAAGERQYAAEEDHGPYHAVRHDGYRVHAGEQGPEEDGEAPQKMRAEAGAGTGRSSVTFFAQEGQAGQHGSYL